MLILQGYIGISEIKREGKIATEAPFFFYSALNVVKMLKKKCDFGLKSIRRRITVKGIVEGVRMEVLVNRKNI